MSFLGRQPIIHFVGDGDNYLNLGHEISKSCVDPVREIQRTPGEAPVKNIGWLLEDSSIIWLQMVTSNSSELGINSFWRRAVLKRLLVNLMYSWGRGTLGIYFLFTFIDFVIFGLFVGDS